MNHSGLPFFTLATLSVEPLAPLMFYAMAALAVVSAWAIVVSRHIVRMAFYLLMTLIGVAGLYFLSNNEFLAAIQLIVYAGGTLILIVFGVMLTARNPSFQVKAQGAEWWLGLSLGLVMAGLLSVALAYSPSLVNATTAIAQSPQASGAVGAGVGGGVGGIGGMGGIGGVGGVGVGLLTTFLVPFELAGVLLLVVMVAAAYMARHRQQGETK